MIEVHPLTIEDYPFVAIEVRLPKTNLLVIQSDTGYVMCGALDVTLLREKLASRHIVAARAVGVKTLDDLLNGTVESCTQAAEELGIQPGMPIREALVLMKQSEQS
ncbi:DUF1805 domain-containing protein [Alicyclobacillus tolerans]|uniref:YunC family protein n=1 Tax=Alicyclobacillus tolerans TaxID=90970 RepID=UPI001F23FE22|nr:DUF1805 domain-containing protein [Alicyclobacillus tolerans]MCF8565375.1 DUF1805 domain-containing protein [Alicyclobacillus tolerans]